MRNILTVAYIVLAELIKQYLKLIKLRILIYSVSFELLNDVFVIMNKEYIFA